MFPINVYCMHTHIYIGLYSKPLFKAVTVGAVYIHPYDFIKSTDYNCLFTIYTYERTDLSA